MIRVMKIAALVVVGFVVVVVLGKNLIAKAVISGGVRAITGLDLRIDRMAVGLFRSDVRVQGLELRNPSGFPEPVMLRIPELYVNYDLGALLQGKVHLEELRVHLEEFVVVKNEAGALNLDALKAVQVSKEPGAAEAEAKGGVSDVRIDILALKIGTVAYRDYSKGTPPKVREFKVNIDERYENISNLPLLAGLIVSRALMKTTVAKLTGFDLGSLQARLDEHLTRAKDLAKAGLMKAGDVAKDVAAKAETFGQDAFSTAGEALQGTTESFKKLIPFGH